MKIINRKAFLEIEEEVLFSKYQPYFFDELMIKNSTCGDNDFGVQDIADAIKSIDCGDFSDKLSNAEEFGTSLEMDFDCGGRDGLFEGDEGLFAVWEKRDIQSLIERLSKLL